MIFTLTLNPAIDVAIRTKQDNHTEEILQKEAAGKGINVSRVLRRLGIDSVVCTVLGGENGEFIKRQLQQEKIPYIMEDIPSNIRENRKYLLSNGSVKEINQEGPGYSIKHIHNLLDALFSQAINGDIIVLSGSIPPNIPSNIYQIIIDECHSRNLDVVLDTSGPALVSGLVAKPNIIKPNKEEFEQIAGRKFTSIKDIIDYSKTLIKMGIKEVIITLGQDGLLYVSSDKVIQIPALDVRVINTVGAGDSFVAGFVAMRDQKRSIEDCLRYASAVATTSVTEQTTVLSNPSLIDRYQKRISINFLSF